MDTTEEQVRIINHTITRLLARREHSASELTRKLLDKGLDAQLIEQQLAAFKAANAQSDQRFAEVLVRSRAAKGFGPQRIRYELNEHRLVELDVSNVILEAEVDWFELACQVLEKKFAQQPPADIKEKLKRQRFLQYRGFTSEQIQYAMQQN